MTELDLNKVVPAAFAALSAVELLVVKPLLRKSMASAPDAKPEAIKMTLHAITLSASLMLAVAIGLYIFRPF